MIFRLYQLYFKMIGHVPADLILVKHWIRFDYQGSKSWGFLDPHALFRIEDSIHFQTLQKNDFADYNRLLETTVQPEHSEERFKGLFSGFDLESLAKEENRICLKWNAKLKKFLVEDGVHRLAILKYKYPHEKIRLNWVKLIQA